VVEALGYRIRREEYALADPGLEPDELAALNLAVATVQVDGLSSGDAMLKLGGAADSLPVPRSPMTSTGRLSAAARLARSIASRTALLWPTKVSVRSMSLKSGRLLVPNATNWQDISLG